MRRLIKENIRKIKMKNDIEYSMDEEKNREKAESVLDKMNNLIRGKSFTKMAVDERFERLQEELNELGWLGFVKTLDFKRGEMRVQLKLVDPDSEEARMFL